MLSLTKYFLKTGTILVIIGLAFGGLGGTRLVHFVMTSSAGTNPTTQQYLRWVVIPHVFLAIGAGLVIFGLILLGKGLHFHIKHPPEDTGHAA